MFIFTNTVIEQKLTFFSIISYLRVIFDKNVIYEVLLWHLTVMEYLQVNSIID